MVNLSFVYNILFSIYYIYTHINYKLSISLSLANLNKLA